MAWYLIENISIERIEYKNITLTVVIPEMVLQVVFILRDKDTLRAEQELLWLNVT